MLMLQEESSIDLVLFVKAKVGGNLVPKCLG